MQFTVWCFDELIGVTDLDFRGVGFAQARSGHFYPNARGEVLMSELASPSHCMRAYMHRNFRDADGNDLLDPEYVNSDWFADVAEHLQVTSQYELELRDENNIRVQVLEIGIQDKLPDLVIPIAREKLATSDADVLTQRHGVQTLETHDISEPRDVLVPRDTLVTRDVLEPRAVVVPRAGAVAHAVSDSDRQLLDELLASDEELMDEGDYYDTPLDLTSPVGWGYEETQGDNELGSGWNTTLRDIRDFPRYQVHVILAETE